MIQVDLEHLDRMDSWVTKVIQEGQVAVDLQEDWALQVHLGFLDKMGHLA